jgi:hypothetical protein
VFATSANRAASAGKFQIDPVDKRRLEWRVSEALDSDTQQQKLDFHHLGTAVDEVPYSLGSGFD